MDALSDIRSDIDNIDSQLICLLLASAALPFPQVFDVGPVVIVLLKS